MPNSNKCLLLTLVATAGVLCTSTEGFAQHRASLRKLRVRKLSQGYPELHGITSGPRTKIYDVLRLHTFERRGRTRVHERELVLHGRPEGLRYANLKSLDQAQDVTFVDHQYGDLAHVLLRKNYATMTRVKRKLWHDFRRSNTVWRLTDAPKKKRRREIADEAFARFNAFRNVVGVLNDHLPAHLRLDAASDPLVNENHIFP